MDQLFETDLPASEEDYIAVAQVAVEQAMDRFPDGLSYGITEQQMPIAPGDRVHVPLGKANRSVAGIVLSLSDPAELDAKARRKLKAIIECEQPAINLPEDLIELARWISEYYVSPLGMVFTTIIPAAVKHGTGKTTQTLIDLADHLPKVGDDHATAHDQILAEHRLPPMQRIILAKTLELAAVGKLPIEIRQLADFAGSRTTGPIRKLIEKELLRTIDRPTVTARFDIPLPEVAARGVTINDEQQQALKTICENLEPSKFDPIVLHGVTGSGKTEVYLQAIERVVAMGRTALVLVPEISLTPQTVSRFTGRFDDIAVLHSGLTAAQRHHYWRQIRDRKVQVVIGARSAIFAPLDQLGLIVVDEEHDTSYKQDQAPRYHGRDVAVMRARLANIPIVLGSATPSMESYYNAHVRKIYRWVSLKQRATGAAMPQVRIVDLADHQREVLIAKRNPGGPYLSEMISPQLADAMRTTIHRGEQIMLLLNRRGYASYLACPDSRCGWVMRCDHCDANMIVHLEQRIKAGAKLRCHYCDFEQRLVEQCPLCHKKLIRLGLGTQRLERDLEKILPDAQVVRMDSDAMRTAKDYENTLARFRAGEAQILMGTQMIAKGLDFANVTLVGVISADTALHLPDFRCEERTFALVAQVAGRSGRADKPGQVIVQTLMPDHASIQYAAKHDYLGFAAHDLKGRQAQQVPPVTRMARIIIRHKSHDAAKAHAKEIAAALNTLAESLRQAHKARIVIRGAMPAAVTRIADYYRYEIMIYAPHAAIIQQLLGDLRHKGLAVSDRTTAIDVDPVILL